jgi:uncharacterized phage protein (TIGR02218 family)
LSKTIPAGLLAHYASGQTTLARLWKVTRNDGAVYGFTDHDQPLSFGGLDYAPSSAFDASAIATRGELNVDDLQVQGLLDNAGITADDIEAGLWDGAAVEIRQVNWADLGNGAELLRVGTVGNVQRQRGQYVVEMRGLMQAFENTIVEVVTPTCHAVLGDARCGVDMDAVKVASAVTTATSRRAFTASGLAQAAGYFTGGQVTFTSGLNDGVSMEIKDHDAGGVLSLQLALPYDLTVADTFDIWPGCDKTKATCIAKFDNLLNFRGFSFVPGMDRILKVGGQ